VEGRLTEGIIRIEEITMELDWEDDISLTYDEINESIRVVAIT
jgi:hypothetical protein